MKKVYLTNHHIISALGFGSEANFNALLEGKSGLTKSVSPDGETIYISTIDKEKIQQEFSVIGNSHSFTPLEQMMILSAHNIIVQANLTITDRTALILSTTKGNIDVLDLNSPFYKKPERAYLTELGKQIQSFFSFQKPAIIVSNACVSGVLAISVAKSLLETNQYDDALIVSGDLVSEFILSGFISFKAISSKPCQPYSKNREGINLGEAVAAILVTSKPTKSENYVVSGSGSSNDANHISGPSRTGEGLFQSITSALKEAQIQSEDIDYISAHGTATLYNDEMESIAFDRLNLCQKPINSFKGYFGHTLGAAGLIETILGIQSLQKNTLIKSAGFDELGVSLPLNIIPKNQSKNLSVLLKTASGFGGSNASIIIQKENL